MYTLRVNTKSGFDTYSAYVFVRGETPGGKTEALDFIAKRRKKFSLLVLYYIEKICEATHPQVCAELYNFEQQCYVQSKATYYRSPHTQTWLGTIQFCCVFK